MAKRRMFSTDIIDDDKFLDMPAPTRLLYYDLGMRADDDGFVSPKKVMRLTGSSEDDLRVLIAKGFIIPFETGVIVIKDWKMNNYIQKDRYTETIYKLEKARISQDANGSYVLKLDAQPCANNAQLEKQNAQSKNVENKEDLGDAHSDVYRMDTQVRLGKVRLGKVRLEEHAQPSVARTSSSKKNTLDGSALKEGFEYFYGKYPRKKDRARAERMFMKVVTDEETLRAVREGIDKWSKEWSTWDEEERKYIPFPSTWINNRRWEDEIETRGKKEPVHYLN